MVLSLCSQIIPFGLWLVARLVFQIDPGLDTTSAVFVSSSVAFLDLKKQQCLYEVAVLSARSDLAEIGHDALLVNLMSARAFVKTRFLQILVHALEFVCTELLFRFAVSTSACELKS